MLMMPKFPRKNIASRRRISFMSTALVAVLIQGCGSSQTVSNGAPTDKEQQIAGMYVVDCLLPGQLRKLGNTTYLTPRRPIKTTAADCNIRGGEYVAYDRADYKTALKVWLPAAEAGDAEAQVAVGEIFEQGLGLEPNYEAAVLWYEKAAKQGNKRGLFNLGTMYEQGQGVPADKLLALNYYREAWGLPTDSVIFQETAQREQRALRAELEKQMASKDAQLTALERQVKSLRDRLGAVGRQSSAGGAENTRLKGELASLNQLLASLRSDRDAVQKKLGKVPRLRAPATAVASKAKRVSSGASNLKVNDLNFGKYYALVIGNKNYNAMEDLETPEDDAREIASLLASKYGFEVQLLLDADRLTVMKAINDLHEILGENDNLLLYYAGHGSLVNVGERDTGYWLPVNADAPPNDSYWVPNEFVTNHMGRLNAKRVLVIADSCYGGLLSSSPGHLFLGTKSRAQDLEYLRYKLPRRSRLLLSSGGNKPVIDSGGGRHSVFAKELIDILASNNEVLSAPALFSLIRKPVEKRAVANNFVQVPVYKSIKGAGHEIGDFFFVPQSKL